MIDRLLLPRSHGKTLKLETFKLKMDFAASNQMPFGEKLRKSTKN